MKANRFKNKSTVFFRRTISWLLIVLMLINLIPESLSAVSAENDDGGFEFSLSWYKNESYGGTDSYVYDSDSRESRMVRLKISYKNNNVTQGYAPGELIITVPGLKDAVRSGRSYIPSSVAADKASDGSSRYNWSYTYSAVTDTFTFTNNTAIDEKSTFEGSFEIVWELPSEATVDGFSKTLQCELITARGEETKSNVITYSQTREPDQYELKETTTPLLNAEGLCIQCVKDADGNCIDCGKGADDYILARYTIESLLAKRARAVDSEKETRFECWFPEGTWISGGGLVKQEGQYQTDADGNRYELWSVVTGEKILENIFVAYPRDRYENQDIRNYVEYYGTYLDEQSESRLAETTIEMNLADYEFIDPEDEIYNVDKSSAGDRSNSYLRQHCDYCSQHGAINALDLSEGKTEYSSTMSIQFNFLDQQADSYDFEFVDDLMDIELQNGTLRRLRDDEYHFTKVKIPGSDQIFNSNGFTINAGSCPCQAKSGGSQSGTVSGLYRFDLYVRTAESEEWTLVTDDTARIQTVSQEIDISGYNAAAFKLIIYDVAESFWTDEIKCSYVFHTDDSDIRTDGGRVINNMYFKLYRTEDGNTEWINDDFSRDKYSSDREFDRDRDLYGDWLQADMGLDREEAELHIIEVPNQFSVSNQLKIDEEERYKISFTGEITSSVTLGENNVLSNFSLYSIVPEGLKLSELYNTPETLMKALEFSGSDGMPSAYIEDHTTIEIIENYNGTGRQYIAFHFDFSDKPITTEEITVAGIPMFTYVDEVDSGNVNVSYTMRAGMLIDQNGKWASDSFDNSSAENGIWSDMDHDGDVSETASFAYSTVTIEMPEASDVELTKFVNTSETNGYVNPTKNEDAALTHVGEEYSYRLRSYVGNTTVTKFVFFDAIEDDTDTVWKGKYVGVDYTAAAEIFGAEPVIWYSEQVENFTERDDLNGGGWTTTRPDTVRSIAIDFGDAVAPSDSTVYIDIIMKAPELPDNVLYDTLTVNKCAIDYIKGNGDHESLDSTAVCVEFAERTGDITLVKRDKTNQYVITGAVFELYRQLGETPDPGTDEPVPNENGVNEYVVGDTGKLVVDKLAFGKYYFKEIAAPKGYERSELLQAAEITADNPSVKVYFDNERKEGQFTIQKVSDRASEAGLAGAEFSLYTADGKELRSGLTTGQDGTCTITGLEWGDYYLTETKAPDGYILSDEKIEFTVNAGNDAGRAAGENGITKIVNEQLPASAVLTKYEALEDGTVTANPLKGAAYELYMENGNPDEEDIFLGTYLTDENGKIYAEDLTFGSYYFTETVSPKGYIKNTDKIQFEVTAAYTSVPLEVNTSDARRTGNVNIRKLNDAGAYVSGAVYGLFDKATGKQVDAAGQESGTGFQTNNEGVIDISGLYWGEYYLQELEAPEGYEKNEEKYEFSVNSDTVSETIQIIAQDNRLKGTFCLTKCAESNESVLLEGAVFTLYRNDGSIYRDNLVTGADGKLVVSDIEWGSYYFLEKTAPAGYGLNSQKIRFSVDTLTAGKTQYYTVADPELQSELTVAKKIKISDIVFEHGNPTFTFRVAGTDASGGSHTYYKTISFDKDYVDRCLDADPDAEYVEASVIFVGIPAGTYTVTEVETNRYETENVEIISGKGTVDGTNAEFKFEEGSLSGEAMFTNKKINQGGTSHTSAAVNIINRQRQLTAIIAKYTGPETITSTMTIDDSVLTVYAVYDDGTQSKLAADKYQLNRSTISDEVNGEFIVMVTYSEGGITRTDFFDVNVSVSEMFTWGQPDNTPIYDAAGNMLYDGTVTITGYTGTSSIVRFPESVTGWRQLTAYGDGVSTGTVTVHSEAEYAGKTYKVTAIEGNGWSSAYGLKDKTGIVLPDTLETIGWQAFRDCSSLSGTLTIPDGVKTIMEGSFMGCTGLNGKLELPDSVIEIQKEAFRNCTGLTGIILSDKLEKVGECAFYDCTNLTGTLDLPYGLKEISGSAFFNCSGLTGNLYIPDTVTTLGDRAFAKCSGFDGTLHLPKNITSIEMNTFYDCHSLQGTLTIPAAVTSIKYGAFWNCYGLTGTLVIPGSVAEIGTGSFEWCGAFQNCYGLTGLIISDGVAAIGKQAFMGCSGLKGDLYIPDSVKTIENRAFAQCTEMDGTLHLPKELTSIEMNTFYDCHSLQGTLTIPAAVTSIKHGAFYRCYGLTGTLIIPDAVTEIGTGTYENCGAFQECSGLTGLKLGKSVQTIGENAFHLCSKMTGALAIPDSVTSIGKQAFRGCYGFDGDLTIGTGIVTIGSHAFWQCYNLTGTVNIPNGAAEIGQEAFYDCRSLTSISVPASVSAIGTNAFGNYWANVPAEYQEKYLQELRLPSSFSPDTFGADSGKTSIIYY